MQIGVHNIYAYMASDTKYDFRKIKIKVAVFIMNMNDDDNNKNNTYISAYIYMHVSTYQIAIQLSLDFATTLFMHSQESKNPLIIIKLAVSI